ncbi:MAG: DUF3014 domain-containing protein [Gammaproteobacteria bacterium]|nr:DUF3014 domain-containing protein [Gammaproteobacteria bacterium]
MQADPNDRQDQQESRSRHSTQTMIMAIAVLVLAGGAYLLAPDDPDDAPADPAPPGAMETAAPVPPQPTPDPAILEAPDIPEREMPAELPQPVVEPETAPAAPPEPTPQELDALLREEVAATGLAIDSSLASAYSAPWLIDRAVAASDQVARGLVPRRTMNLARPAGDFAVVRDGQRRLLDTAGYRRYDALVSAITALPAESLAGLFHQFRPQLQAAYSELGYPPEAMDNALIAALDQVLAAPEVSDPMELRSKGALWAYSDPALEDASDMHKQLLRSGPENTRRIKAWVEALRSALLAPD